MIIWKDKNIQIQKYTNIHVEKYRCEKFKKIFKEIYMYIYICIILAKKKKTLRTDSKE